MNNYPYLIAGLPELFPDFDKSSLNIDLILDKIIENIHSDDVKYLNWLLFGLDPQNLTSHFYRRVLKVKCGFLNNYFIFDLNIRNIQVAYLAKERQVDGTSYFIGNSELITALKSSRASDFGASEFFEETPTLLSALSNPNILEREKALDLMRWNKINEIVIFNHFDIDWLLAFITKLMIIKRWDELDKKEGSALFKKLVDEVRETYKGQEIKDLETNK